MSQKIAIIGGGNLGCAIAEGLIKSEFSRASDICITRRNLTSLTSLAEQGMKVGSDNIAAVKNAEIIIIAVKPFQIAGVIEAFNAELSEKHTVISVVTGVSLSDLQEIITKKISLFRAMPNTAISLQESITCISHNNASEEKVQSVTDLFSKLGRVKLIEEKLMNAATVLGACGTAYAMRYIRANIQAGIEIGFDAKTASIIAAQTVKGAAELLLKNDSHPEQEIDKVTTPKGCTIAGLNEMEHRGFSSSLIRGVIASYKKISKD